MRFYISNPEAIHEKLLTLPKPLEGDLLEDEEGDRERCCIFSFPVNLPSPLFRAKMQLSRELNNCYAASALIEAVKESSVFEGISNEFARKVRNFSFYETHPDGLGYLCKEVAQNQTVEPSISINSNPLIEGIDPLVRVISVGGYGTHLREIPELEKFGEDITDLMLATNWFIEACTEKTPKPERMIIPFTF